MRVPCPSGLTRITTSSRKPMIGVRATASILPGRVGAGARVSMISHLRLVTMPSAMS